MDPLQQLCVDIHGSWVSLETVVRKKFGPIVYDKPVSVEVNIVKDLSRNEWDAVVTLEVEGRTEQKFVEPLNQFPSDTLAAQLMLVV